LFPIVFAVGCILLQEGGHVDTAYTSNLLLKVLAQSADLLRWK
jgi:hypothetical protein